MKNRLGIFWQDYKSFFIFILLMTVFRSAIADWNHVPTGSMKPTILEGDQLFINKMAYDIRLPFTTYSLVQLANPARGDIVVFESAVSDKRLVKRVIGTPGDRVAMINNRLSINDQPLTYKLNNSSPDTSDYTETLDKRSYTIRVKHSANHPVSFSLVTVPAGYYLVLGDNRDESLDSRFIGFVPRREIIGKSSRLTYSLDYDNYYLPRSERFLHRL